MKKLILVILLITTNYAFSQNWPVKQLVLTKKAQQVPFVNLPIFDFVADRPLFQRGVYQQLKLNASFSKIILENRPEAIHLSIPIGNNKSVECDLVRFSLGNIKFTENNNGVVENVKIPATYRGVVQGEQGRNNVILTVNDAYISFVASFTNKALQIVKADDEPGMYRLYNSLKVAFPITPINCGTTDGGSGVQNGIALNGIIQSPGVVSDKCVNVFVECFDSLYQWRNNNMGQTISYVYELFAAVATGYFNEQINIQVIGINVWTTADPYRGTNRDTALADLSGYYKDNFWGNICVGLDYSVSNIRRFGLAGLFGHAKAVVPDACKVYTQFAHQFCYNDVNYLGNYSNFPVGPNATEGAIYQAIHEIGHLLGSRHTQWCGWQLTPATTGAIDNCAPVEGTCPPGDAQPDTGGTIMSYCIDSGHFINFNNGFGLLPGNTVRNFVDQNNCIPKCLDCNYGNPVMLNNAQKPEAIIPSTKKQSLGKQSKLKKTSS